MLIVKTQDDYGNEIENLIRQYISYTNFIGEISPTAINSVFLDWLNAEVPLNRTILD